MMKQNKTPLITIIVPVYKVEQYLPTCIESILDQTFRNFELILIDDGSPDNSGVICDQYAQKDNRIVVIHKGNGGVSSARNIGLKKAHGDFIVFVDADDYIYPNCLSLLIKKSENSDWVIGGYFSNGHSIKPEQAIYDEKDINSFWKRYANTLFCATTWAAMYKLEIIRKYKIDFDEKINLGEDTLFNANYLLYCNKIVLISDVLYFYNTPISYTISDKYNISYSEMLNQIDKTKNVYSKLNSRYDFHDQLESRIRTIFSFYPYEQLLLYGDNEIIKLYINNIHNSTKQDYYKDPICSPINKGLQYIKECFRKKNICKEDSIITFYKKYNAYFYLYKPIYKVDKLILSTLNLKLFYLTRILIKIYLKLRK